MVADDANVEYLWFPYTQSIDIVLTLKKKWMFEKKIIFRKKLCLNKIISKKILISISKMYLWIIQFCDS